MKKIYIILVIILVILISVFYIKRNNNLDYENIYIEETDVENIIEEKISTIKIHVVGEVQTPGMYEVDIGSRIDDLIRKAGGCTENADLNKINLAYEVSDGEKIYIPSIFDEENEYNVSSDNETVNNKININKASVEELQTINGIGESLANKIVNYRKENGRFSSIEDLKNVSGIGDKKYENIKEYIVIK